MLYYFCNFFNKCWLFVHCWTKPRYLNFWIFSQQLTTTTQDSGEESGCFTEGKFKKRSPVTGLLGGEKRWIVKGVQNSSERGTGEGEMAAASHCYWPFDVSEITFHSKYLTVSDWLQSPSKLFVSCRHLPYLDRKMSVIYRRFEGTTPTGLD